MISRLLHPKSVAVIGASTDVSKMRGKILRCLIGAGFKGAIYPVNPGYDEIQGLKAYASVEDLPEAPDLLLIAVPGAGVPAIIEKAAARGCGAAVVFSADVSADDMARAASGAREKGMRLVGPNTEGLYLPGAGLAATFAHVVEDCIEHPPVRYPARRPIAMVSQSGGIGFALFGRALHEHLDIHSVITTGNEADLECLDFVEQLVEDGETGVILMFIEGFKDARRFAAIAEKAAARQIPLVVMKAGQSEAGQRAAISHTAHLAGADTAYDAVFERHGVIRVFDAEEMLSVAAALSRMPFTEGSRAAVITASGGAGGWAADLLAARDISLPVLSNALQQKIESLVAAFASAANPVDVTGHAVEHGAKTMIKVIEAVAGSDEIDAVLVNMGLANAGRVRGMRETLQPVLEQCGKPVLFHSHILPSEENLAALAEIGAHGFPSFRACASALHALHRYGSFQAARRKAAAAPEAAASAISAFAMPAIEEAGVLDEVTTRALLDHYGIPVPASAVVADAAAAAAAAGAMGYPVVLKIQSPDIAHKTEAGGVELHVRADTLEAAYARLIENVKRNAPAAYIEGVLVQKMMPAGYELVVGVVNDPDFGPLVMLGSGGIYVEVLKDVVFAPPPINRTEALRMIDALKVSAILKGARGRPAADIEALAALLSRVGDMAAAGEKTLDQIDLNPVLVYEKGQGVVAVDSLVATKKEAA